MFIYAVVEHEGSLSNTVSLHYDLDDARKAMVKRWLETIERKLDGDELADVIRNTNNGVYGSNDDYGITKSYGYIMNCDCGNDYNINIDNFYIDSNMQKEERIKDKHYETISLV